MMGSASPQQLTAPGQSSPLGTHPGVPQGNLCLRAATRLRRSRVCCGLLLCASLTAGPELALAQIAPAQPSVQDLAELTAVAVRRSHDLEAAKHRMAAAEARLSEAQISPFFQFTLEGGVAWVPDANGADGYTFDNPNWVKRDFGPAVQGKVRGAVPLWTFGKLSAAREAAGAGVQAATAEKTQAANRLVHDLRRAYFGLQLALDAKQMLSEGQPKLVKALERFEERMAAGDTDAEPVDGYRLADAVVEVEARESEATRLERSARYALQLLTHQRQVQVPDCPLAPVELELEPVEQYVEHAMGTRPEVRMLRAARVAKRAETEAKRAAFFPDIALALEAEASYIPGQTAFEHYRPYFLGAAIVARWNLDLWGHKVRAERSDWEAKALQAQSNLAEQGIRLEVQTQYETVLDAERRLSAWKRGHQSARRWFVSSAQGYEVGTVTAKELIDGVTAYFKARFAHLQAIHDHNMAIAGLEVAVGRPLVRSGGWEAECAAWMAEPE